MAFMRTDTPKSMMSRAWSTNDLGAALEHIVLNKDELPDDLSQLEVRVFQSSEDSIVFRNIKPVGSRPVHSFFQFAHQTSFHVVSHLRSWKRLLPTWAPLSRAFGA